jgi:flagellar biosynthesis GTPase FlhF
MYPLDPNDKNDDCSLDKEEFVAMMTQALPHDLRKNHDDYDCFVTLAKRHEGYKAKAVVAGAARKALTSSIRAYSALDEEARRVEEEAKKVEEEARRVEEEARRVEEEAKKVEEEAKKVEEGAKKVEEEATKVEEEATHVEKEEAVAKQEAASKQMGRNPIEIAFKRLAAMMEFPQPEILWLLMMYQGSCMLTARALAAGVASSDPLLVMLAILWFLVFPLGFYLLAAYIMFIILPK